MKNDGGPAFPVSVDRPLVAYSYSGLSLRDYFAASAVRSFSDLFLTNKQAAETIEAAGGGSYCEGAAKMAYALADAMIAEREKP